MTQLEDDVDNRIKDKLYLWIKDSYALYDMAELDRGQCGATISYCLIQALVGVLIGYRVPRGKAIRLLLDIWSRSEDTLGRKKAISLGESHDDNRS